MIRFWDRYFIPAVFVLGLFFTFNMNKGNRIWSVAYGDSEGYYSYLPGLFIFGNYTAGDGGNNEWITSCCLFSEETKILNRYPYGVSVLETPFFLAAHVIASIQYGKGSAAPADWQSQLTFPPSAEIHRQYHPDRGYATGYSRIYLHAIQVSGVFYLCLGLWFLKKTLKRYFSTAATLLTLFILTFGTNVFFYAFGAPGMSHVYSFFLIAFFIWQLYGLFESPTWGRSILLGSTYALLCFVRPSNMILIVALPLVEVYTVAGFKLRMSWLLRQWKLPVTFLLTGFIVAMPQFLYYKATWGVWFPDTYAAEGFDFWKSPQIGNVLFSHQNGFFIYAPLMLIFIPGLIRGWQLKKGSPALVTAIFILATYVFASWWCWWFGGAYGHRCYVDIMPLLALPVALFSEWVLDKGRKWMIGLYLFSVVFFAHGNIKMSYLYKFGGKSWDGTEWTWKSYWKQWDKTLSLFQNWP
jgi:hypothetical protein